MNIICPILNNVGIGQAACVGQTEKMFPRDYEDKTYVTEAREICDTCPVQEQCLEYALTFPPLSLHGIWAGRTSRQLYNEAQKRGITEHKPTLVKLWKSYHKPVK